MIDRERIQTILSELDSYLAELEEAVPENFKEYTRSNVRRTCERLLQISLECIIDISILLVKGLHLGPPSDEEDAFTKLETKGVITENLAAKLRDMKGLRNVLVHRYAQVNNRKVYEVLENHLGDFEEFKKVVLEILKKAR